MNYKDLRSYISYNFAKISNEFGKLDSRNDIRKNVDTNELDKVNLLEIKNNLLIIISKIDSFLNS